jgi:flagellar biogenesis protein FliO
VNRLFCLAARRPERRLHLREMLSLGEKRFVAVVEYEGQKFLLAGTPQNISLLQCLNQDAETPVTSSSPEWSLH